MANKGLYFDFTAACIGHDRCYGGALQNDGRIDEAEQKRCDVAFAGDMDQWCYDNTGVINGKKCLDRSGYYYLGVRACGNGGWICPGYAAPSKSVSPEDLPALQRVS